MEATQTIYIRTVPHFRFNSADVSARIKARGGKLHKPSGLWMVTPSVLDTLNITFGATTGSKVPFEIAEPPPKPPRKPSQAKIGAAYERAEEAARCARVDLANAVEQGAWDQVAALREVDDRARRVLEATPRPLPTKTRACRTKGCGYPATASGYCERCGFDRWDS